MTTRKTTRPRSTSKHRLVPIKIKIERHVAAPATAAQIRKALGITAKDMTTIEEIAAKSSPFKHQKKVSRARR